MPEPWLGDQTRQPGCSCCLQRMCPLAWCSGRLKRPSPQQGSQVSASLRTTARLPVISLRSQHLSPSVFHYATSFCHGGLLYSLTGPCTHILTSDHRHTSSLTSSHAYPQLPTPLSCLSFCDFVTSLTRASCKSVGIVLSTGVWVTSSGYITVESDFSIYSSPWWC